MPVQLLSQALTPYFTTKAAAGGTGLGLVQVQRFAERQGGTIGMVSEQGGLDRAIEHLVVASDPRTLGEMRKHFHGDLRGKIIGELARDFSRRPLDDYCSRPTFQSSIKRKEGSAACLGVTFQSLTRLTGISN